MVSDTQVRLYRQKRMDGNTQAAAAASAGMSIRTAREWDTGPVPSVTKHPRDGRTRPDPFATVWSTEIEPLLQRDQKGVLEAKFGPDVVNGSGWDLTTLRLGALMRESGYEPTGADPDRHFSGVMPWFGSLPQVERRIADLKKQRAEAEARLDNALLDDAERERRAAENKAHIAAENARPVRKVRGDGSQYERHADGRIVEVAS